MRGLSDISVISSLSGLQYLFLQSLRNVTSMPDLSGLNALRRIYLENMKGLKDVRGVFMAPALEEFIHVCAQNMELSQYRDLLNMRSLKRVLIGFKSEKRNPAFVKEMREKNIERYRYSPFTFA